jgi:hypothetical protein
MKRVYLVSESDLQELKSALLDRSWLRPMIEKDLLQDKQIADTTDSIVTELERRFGNEIDNWIARAK